MEGRRVKYLLDTSVWLCGYFQPETIPEQSRRILASARERFGVSAISLWELGKKHQLGKLPLDRDPEAWFRRAVGGNVEVLPLTWARLRRRFPRWERAC